jgi:hypothetical protein
VFVAVAIVNSGFRDAVLTPRLGEFGGHITSTILLCAAMLVVTWLTIGWIRPAKSTEALLIGGGWVLMTVALSWRERATCCEGESVAGQGGPACGVGRACRFFM